MNRDRYGVIYLTTDEAKSYPATLLTIPEIGKRLAISTSDAGRLLDELGLRWKGPDDRWLSKVPTKYAAVHGIAVTVEGRTDYGDYRRWDWERLSALLETAMAPT